jgi:hypothetical protein
MRLLIEEYAKQNQRWSQQGRVILAQSDADPVIVYQAYRPSIGHFAAEHGHFGGGGFSMSRMTWIKPNFLWMMYRSGRGTNEGQEFTLRFVWLGRHLLPCLSSSQHQHSRNTNITVHLMAETRASPVEAVTLFLSYGHPLVLSGLPHDFHAILLVHRGSGLAVCGIGRWFRVPDRDHLARVCRGDFFQFRSSTTAVHYPVCGMAFSLLLVTVQNVGRVVRDKSDGRVS